MQAFGQANDLFANLFNRGGAAVFTFFNVAHQRVGEMIELLVDTFQSCPGFGRFQIVDPGFEGAHQVRIVTGDGAFDFIGEVTS